MNPTSRKSDSTTGGTWYEISLPEFFSLLVGGKTTILVLFVLGILGGAVYTFTSAPSYEATARILIDQNAGRATVPFRDTGPADPLNKVTNELEALRSLAVSGAVAETLMARRFLDDQKTTVLPLVAAGEKVSPDPARLQRYLMDRLQRSIDFVPVKESDVIRIVARSTNPVEAALLANLYSAVYTKRSLAVSRSRTREAREFLQDQLAEKHRALRRVENELQAYMQTSGIVALDVDTRKTVEQLAQLEATRDAVEIDIGTHTKTLQSYRDQLTRLGPNVAKSIGESGDAYIRLLQEQLAKLEVQRDLAIAQNPGLATQASSSQQFKDVETQIGTLKNSLRERTANFIASVIPSNARTGTQEGFTGFLGEMKQKVIEEQVEIDGLTARRETLSRVMKEYERQFSRIPQKSMEYARLQRARLSDEKLYLMVEEKFNELAISESAQVASVVVLDEAIVPLLPVHPVLLIDLAVGALSGLCLGILAVILQAVFETRIFTAQDLRRRGFTVLSTVGKMAARTLPSAFARQTDPLHPVPPLDPHLVVWTGPLHPASESFRHLFTSLRHSQAVAGPLTLVVTSPNPGEGKSTTAANLALAAAEANKRTLLVDADLRRPTVHTLFGLENEAGFSDYLLRQATCPDLIHPDAIPHLDVMTSGPPAANPAAALASGRVEALLQELRDKYDLVVFDVPPLHAVSDASVIAACTDGSLIVVSAGKTTVPSLEGGLESLRRVGAKVYGVVLNNYDARRLLQYHQGDVGYGYYGYGYAHRSNNGREKVKTVPG